MAFSRSHVFTYFLLVLIPYAASISFDLKKITTENLNQDIRVNKAYISEYGLQMTTDENGSDRSQRAGRATYIRQFHLWDKRSNELASFSTNFTFVIDSNGTTTYGDGLTFFLAQDNSLMYTGGSMGLPVNEATINSTIPFVAVEFDTFENNWDPSGVSDHVGISISSLISVRYQKWSSNIPRGGECEAWITYDSVSKNLNVSFTGFQDNTIIRQVGLVYTVDLRDVLPERVIFGFSAATGDKFQKNNVKSWSFSSSDLQADEKNTMPPKSNLNPTSISKPGPSPVDDNNNNNNNKKVELVVGLVVAVAFVVVFVFVLWKMKKKNGKKDGDGDGDELGFGIEIINEFEMGMGPKRFSYQELARSTSEFSESEKLGEGGFGGVYKGFLKDPNTYIAVKRVSKSSKQGIKEYASEVKIISRLRHRNLVKLIGWCHEKRELLLVYEFMENGSLDLHLFKAKSLLTWGTRYKIAHGLASALLYLHEEWDQCVLHRDIKSSNVMLDSNFNAKLGDFGLAKLVDHEKGSQTTMLAGTFGYMAPECLATGKATKESDVFSFGVVALEIACGRKIIEYKAQEKQIRLVDWVWGLYGADTLLEAIDTRLGLDFEEEEITRLMILGLWCVHPDSDFRPSMRQAVQVLNFEASLPILPLKMSVASYFDPPLSSLHDVASIFRNQSSSNVLNKDSSKQTSSMASSSPSVSLLHSLQ